MTIIVNIKVDAIGQRNQLTPGQSDRLLYKKYVTFAEKVNYRINRRVTDQIASTPRVAHRPHPDVVRRYLAARLGAKMPQSLPCLSL